MQKFIPKEKLGKKAQRELNRAKRKTWGALNPVTRKPANPKAYHRRKVQKGEDDVLRFEPFIFLFRFFVFPGSAIARTHSIQNGDSR